MHGAKDYQHLLVQLEILQIRVKRWQLDVAILATYTEPSLWHLEFTNCNTVTTKIQSALVHP